MSGQYLENSHHGAMPGALFVGPVAADEIFTATLMLRRRSDGPPFPSIEELGAQPPLQRQYLTHAEFTAKFGAHPGDMDRVRQFASAAGLEVKAVDLARRTLAVAGTAERFSAAFAVPFARFLWGGRTYRAPIGPLSIPAGLHPVITAVLGLDERPAGHPALARRPDFWSPADALRAQSAASVASAQHLQAHLAPLQLRLSTAIAQDPSFRDLLRRSSEATALARRARVPASAGRIMATELLPAARKATDRARRIAASLENEMRDAYNGAQRAALLAALNAVGVKTPPQVAELYDFPADADGTGECIAIIELGGGYRPDLLPAYFDIIGVPTPEISAISVGGGANLPGVIEPYDSEVCLDIDVIGGVAPGARLVCYFAPLTAAGMIEAVHTAIHDDKNNPSIISLSWSLSEAFWVEAPMYVACLEEVLQEAALLGITVCVAAGDYGAASEFHDGAAWVNYPASSPYVLSCGGTTLHAAGAQIIYEPVWNILYPYGQATGGGISQLFSSPAWQAAAQVPQSINPGGRTGRGVPDVAGNADPFTGYFVQINDHCSVIAGTSSVAPLWSALIARTNQQLGVRVGYINPLLYAGLGHGFRDVVQGGNGGYWAHTGWDPCTGWGSPNGTAFCNGLARA